MMAIKANRDACYRIINPPRTRSTLEFAEQEIVIPTGEYSGQRWKADRQPWTRLLFREVDSGQWSTVVTTGPSQSGKTQSCFAIPTLHTLAELAENFVLGVPDEDMADKKWRTDLLPIMQASPSLRPLIPQDGPGSRGGKVRDTIQFGNGVVAAIMTRGSSDASKAGFTARCVHVTEAAEWSQGTETSEEADPLRQLRARQRSYRRERRRMLIEGTVKIPQWLPWKLRGDDDGPLVSTRSRLVTPCPHCGEWISPEREHFVGWKGADSEEQACSEATFICPACTTVLTDDDRKQSNRDVKLLHFGQEIDREGNITGELPPTSTLWFRYSQWNNLLLTSADLAEDEWKADQVPEGTQDRDDAERELCQFQWCVPFVSLLDEREELKAATIRKRQQPWGRGKLPGDTEKVTLAIDIGDWTAWWLAIAWRKGGQRHICDYGAFDVKRSPSDELGYRIIQSLQEFADSVIEKGFAFENSDTHRLVPAEVWVDGRYQTDFVAEFVRGRGSVSDNRYKLAMGVGKSASVGISGGSYTHPAKRTTDIKRIGREWHAKKDFDRRILKYMFNADYWKLSAHEGLRADFETIGAITLFNGEPHEHDKVSHHFANEQLHRSWEPNKGYVDKWVRTGEQGQLDCLAMASAAGDSCQSKRVVDMHSRPSARDLAGKR